MSTFVGDSGDWSGTSVAWPAGVQVGDLAVMALATKRNVGGLSQFPWAVPDGWVTAATYVFNGRMWTYGISPTVETAGIAWKVVRSGDLSGPVVLPESIVRGVMAVYRGGAGIGGVRASHAYLPVVASASVFNVRIEQEASGGSPDVTTIGGSWMVRPWLIDGGHGAHSYSYLRAGRSGPVAAAGPSGALGHAGMAVEILPPAPPAPPSWREPGEGQGVSQSDDLPVSWTHHSVVPGGSADAWRLQVAVVSGGTGDPVWDKWYDPVTRTLVSAEHTVSSATMGTDLPESLLVSGDRVAMRVQTREALDGRWSPWSPVRSVLPTNPPTVSVTGPTGTVTDDLTPTVTWTMAGGTQVAAQARVVGPGSTGYDDNVLADTGVFTTGTGMATLPVGEYVNGGQHRAWVRAQKSGGAWSPWTSGALFTMAWTTPAAPTVAAAVADRGIEVTIGGADVEDVVEVERLDGASWVPVASVTVDADGPVEMTDLLAPYGVDVTYRARIHGSLDGASIPGDWGTSTVVRSLDGGCYLVDAEDLSRWLPVKWTTDGVHTYEQPVSVMHGIGSPRPRVAYGTYLGRSGRWVFGTGTRAAREALVEFWQDARAVTLRMPPERESGAGWVDGGSITVRRAAPLALERLYQSAIAHRRLEVAWVEADPVTPSLNASGSPVGPGGVLRVTGVTVGPGGALLIEGGLA